MKSASLLLLLIMVSPISIGASIQRKAVRPAGREEAQEPRPVTQEVLGNAAIRRVEPRYPNLAQAARVTGTVAVEVTVDENGRVIATGAPSGHVLLKDAAVAAARGWKFSPSLLGNTQGVPAKVTGTITFIFGLERPSVYPAGASVYVEPNEERIEPYSGSIMPAWTGGPS